MLGTGTLNSSGVAAFMTSSLPTGVLSIAAVYSGDAGFAGSTSSAFSESVMPGTIATSITLTASPNPAAFGQPLTLTATVSPAPTGNPAGSISFYSGSALLVTGTLDASGTATFIASNLAVGSDSITALYSGNAGFAASTSSVVAQTITTAYTVTAPSALITVAPGGTATVDITVPPLGGAFSNAVTLSTFGLPPGATATFNPPTVTPGSAGAQTVMTIQLAAQAANLPGGHIPPTHHGLPGAPFTLGFFLFGAVLGCKRLAKNRALALLIAGLGVTAGLLTGCGSSAGGANTTQTTSSGSYVLAITVTGTSGALQASTTVTLEVQ
jgi:hypothetical protein